MNDTNQTEDHNHQLEVKSLWNRSFILLILVSLITAMSFNMVYVIISKYALEVTPSLTIAGVIAGIFSIAALIIRPIAGVTADTMNKKKIMYHRKLVNYDCIVWLYIFIQCTYLVFL